MTVPVVGVLHRKAGGWRYLPEIHASRLSVSGSLRPKIGLLILFVLVITGLVLLVIPLVRQFHAAGRQTLSPARHPESSLQSPATRILLHFLQNQLLLADSTTTASLPTANSVVSPAGLLFSLGVLHTGTGSAGPTRGLLEDFLAVGGPPGTQKSAAAPSAHNLSLVGGGAGGGVHLVKLFVDTSVDLSQDFVTELLRQKVGVERADINANPQLFRDSVAKWTAAAIGPASAAGRWLAGEVHLPAELILLNLHRFTASPRGFTVPAVAGHDTFYLTPKLLKQVRVVSGTGFFPIDTLGPVNGGQMVELELAGGGTSSISSSQQKPPQLSIVFLLPPPSDEAGLSVLLPHLPEVLERILTDSRRGRDVPRSLAEVRVPVFSVEGGILDGRQFFSGLGVAAVFAEGADFTRATTNANNRSFHPTDVSHVVKFDLKEDTVSPREKEAAAAVLSVPVLRINRPFLFFILDRGAGSVLYSGLVRDPTILAH